MFRKFMFAVVGGVLAFSSTQALADHHGGKKEMKGDWDIVQIASKDPQFSTLVTAIKEAGLVGTLKGDGPFTVFAPTNDAFAELPDGALDELLKDKDKLRAVLTYHVVPGNIMSEDIKGKTTDVETVEGSTLAVDATDGVMINDAMVIKADIKAKNGVNHVIDAVLMPGQ